MQIKKKNILNILLISEDYNQFNNKFIYLKIDSDLYPLS